jgi:PAS domain S-box-containing protein
MKKASISKIVFDLPRFLILTGISLSVILSFADAQTQNFQFKHLTINDGLSNSWVRSIAQDHFGFMWIGTDDGLNRFDGYTFRVYRNDIQDDSSISSSSTRIVFEDHNGALWIGTRRGLNIYDSKTERFIRCPRWANQIIFAIAEEQNTYLWIATSTGLYRLNLKNENVSFYSPDSVWGRNQRGSAVTAITVDSRKHVWISSNNGLHLYDNENNNFINYYHDENNPHSLSSNDVRSIFEDKAGRIWIGTAAGLDEFTNAQDTHQEARFEHYHNDINDQKSISPGVVLTLLENDSHNLLIGIENGGLDLLDLNTIKKGVNNFIHYKNDPTNSSSLNNNSIYSLFRDRQGSMWIGTFGDGLNMMNPIADKFTRFSSELGNNKALNNTQVNVFLEEKNFLWIGTEGGLNRYNKKNDTYTYFVHNPSDTRSIGSNAVWSLCKDTQGNLWVGTWGGGLNRFDYRTETFEHFYHDPLNSNSLGSNNVFSLVEDGNGSLWIGTMGNGLNVLDRTRKKLTRYDITNSGIYSNYVPSIIKAKNGDLWFSNESVLGHFDMSTKKIKYFMHVMNDSTMLSSNKVMTVFEDSKGNLWVGTGGGLNLFNRGTEKFLSYQVKHGLPNNTINSILEDDLGNLWLGTNKGLSKFIDAIHLPVKPQFRNYAYEDGLQSNEFGHRSCLRSANGLLYFGGSNGFNVFDPKKIIENTYIPPIVFTDFEIFNKSVPLDVAKELVLSYTQSVFSFDFAALNYISTAKNEYAYKMEGFDKDWNYVGTKHTATYTNLDPGKYIFRVKGSNNDGVWNEQGAALPIVITPPYWLTLWFRLLLLVVVGGIIFWIYQWRMQARDLAAQKWMEAALTKERNLLRTVIDNLPDGVYTKDIHYRKTLTNRVDVFNMGRKSEAEVIGKDDYELFPKEIAEGFIADDKQVVQTGVPVVNREERVIDANGRQHFLLTTKLPFRDEHNQIVGIIGIGRDITERKLAEEEREKLIAELQDAAADIKVLSGLVPICASCKAIRDDKGYWTQLEKYIQAHSLAKFSHGVCPDCMKKLYPKYAAKNADELKSDL